MDHHHKSSGEGLWSWPIAMRSARRSSASISVRQKDGAFCAHYRIMSSTRELSQYGTADRSRAPGKLWVLFAKYYSSGVLHLVTVQPRCFAEKGLENGRRGRLHTSHAW